MRRSIPVAMALVAATLAASAVPASADGFRYSGHAASRYDHAGFGPRASGYRALPPVSGTLHPGPHGLYGDRSFGRLHYADREGLHAPMGRGYGPHDGGFGEHRHFADDRGGAAIYDVGHHRHHAFARRLYGSSGVVYGGRDDYADAGYGSGVPAPAESYAEGTPDYVSQGFAPVSGAGYGPVTYQQTAGYGYGYGYGQGGGLGVYSPGAFGPGPSIIAVPSHYNVHTGCGCAPTGLFGSLN